MPIPSGGSGASGVAYATLQELKARVMPSLASTANDAALTNALDVASRSVDAYCRRTFTKDDAATARTFTALSPCLVHVDDFHTTTDLVIGVDGTELTADDYRLGPLRRHGETWPNWQIKTRSGASFPCTEDAIEVTAQWGWAEVPAAVKEATLVLAEETFKLKDAPFGVAGFGDFGMHRVRDNPKVASMLIPYRRQSVLVR